MSNRFSRRQFGSGSTAVLTSIAIVKGRARAADFTMKLGTAQALGAPINVRAKQCFDRVFKETHGRVDLQLFPNNVLGGMTSMLTQVRTGALEFLAIDGNALSGFIPIAAICFAGWTFKTSAQGFIALDGELGNYIRNAIRAKGLYCHDKTLLVGMKQVTSLPHPIASPDDFHGFKIRVPNGAITVDLFRTLGASVAAMDVNEVYTALQTRVVDGQENPLVNIEFQRFFEVQRYLSLTSHGWSGYYLIGNQESWNALPPDLRTIVARNLGIFANAQNRDVAILNDSLLDKLKRQGLIVNLPAAEPFRARLGAYYQRWQNEYGSTAWALLEKYTGKLSS
jgi:TRAP-type transport system periplasmic protein